VQDASVRWQHGQVRRTKLAGAFGDESVQQLDVSGI
jgi:hypothetical protein